mmetsp:Transcript_11126/g.30851  ORF Transcript_11126/g.30851 Transcript_11126/m.30851 type:complete len:140 (+) Transcript_11126:1742-2161(+)
MQVLDLDVDGTRARVRLVPRLRLSDEDEESKRRVRPPPKLFDVEDMRAKGEDVGSVQRGARGRAVHFFENQVRRVPLTTVCTPLIARLCPDTVLMRYAIVGVRGWFSDSPPFGKGAKVGERYTHARRAGALQVCTRRHS